MGRNELKFQKHLIDSYENCGGMARKWASEWQKGPADLVCAHPLLQGHLVEVKHRPTFGNKNISIQNPMDTMQIKSARSYISAGMPVFLAIVRGEMANQSQVAYFDPLSEMISPAWPTVWFDYVPGKKFPINKILVEAGNFKC
jgi:hypothetical protein